MDLHEGVGRVVLPRHLGRELDPVELGGDPVESALELLLGAALSVACHLHHDLELVRRVAQGARDVERSLDGAALAHDLSRALWIGPDLGILGLGVDLLQLRCQGILVKDTPAGGGFGQAPLRSV